MNSKLGQGEVELHPAYWWTCPHCGKDFWGAIAIQTQPGRSVYFIPDRVECGHCGTETAVVHDDLVPHLRIKGGPTDGYLEDYAAT